MEETIDCPHCGKCPICDKQNNHYYHKHPPWNRFPCHPFHDGIKEEVEEKVGEKKAEPVV